MLAGSNLSVTEDHLFPVAFEEFGGERPEASEHLLGGIQNRIAAHDRRTTGNGWAAVGDDRGVYLVHLDVLGVMPSASAVIIGSVVKAP